RMAGTQVSLLGPGLRTRAAHEDESGPRLELVRVGVASGNADGDGIARDGDRVPEALTIVRVVAREDGGLGPGLLVCAAHEYERLAGIDATDEGVRRASHDGVAGHGYALQQGSGARAQLGALLPGLRLPR